MNTERFNKREREYYWEWLYNAQALPAQKASSNLFIANTVIRLLQESGADNCLHYLCGSGALSKVLAEKGRNILAYETSSSAIKAAKRLSGDAADTSLIYFQGSNTTPLADVIPHKVAAVFSEELLLEPNWHELKNEFSRIYDILNPGGLLIFAGASEQEYFASDLIAEFDNKAEQEIIWNIKDGRTQCTKLFLKAGSAEDFRDYKSLFVISNTEDTTLECLEHRIPGYWNYHNIRDLVYEIGFSHFEARVFTGDESNTTLKVIFNIAYKPGILPGLSDNYSEETAYRDF